MVSVTVLGLIYVITRKHAVITRKYDVFTHKYAYLRFARPQVDVIPLRLAPEQSAPAPLTAELHASRDADLRRSIADLADSEAEADEEPNLVAERTFLLDPDVADGTQVLADYPRDLTASQPMDGVHPPWAAALHAAAGTLAAGLAGVSDASPHRINFIAGTVSTSAAADKPSVGHKGATLYYTTVTIGATVVGETAPRGHTLDCPFTVALRGLDPTAPEIHGVCWAVTKSATGNWSYRLVNSGGRHTAKARAGKSHLGVVAVDPGCDEVEAATAQAALNSVALEAGSVPLQAGRRRVVSPPCPASPTASTTSSAAAPFLASRAESDEGCPAGPSPDRAGRARKRDRAAAETDAADDYDAAPSPGRLRRELSAVATDVKAVHALCKRVHTAVGARAPAAASSATAREGPTAAEHKQQATDLAQARSALAAAQQTISDLKAEASSRRREMKVAERLWTAHATEQTPLTAWPFAEDDAA
jgi:hypothetical protein